MKMLTKENSTVEPMTLTLTSIQRKILREIFNGITPITAREIAWRVYGDESRAGTILSHMQKIRERTPKGFLVSRSDGFTIGGKKACPTCGYVAGFR